MADVDLNRNSLVLDALSKPQDAIYASLSQSLAAGYPTRFIGEVESAPFDLERFAHDGKCSARDVAYFHSQWSINWWEERHAIYRNPYTAWRSVAWEGHDLEVLTVGVTSRFSRELRHFVIADTKVTCDAFVSAACLWCSEVRGEILVFQDGCWQHDHDLLGAVSDTTLDTLILKAELKETIVTDVERFLNMREAYTRYGLPWKRGILLMGPPGNGKTHMIKGVINHFEKPCLYIRTFTSEYGTDEDNIRKVFRRARSTTPCLLVFEDLDAMLNDENRSFFLNELDGFQNNDGLLTIATTNHPERLDPAILSRPSRFDRKFTFDLPELSERWRFLQGFGLRLEPNLRLSANALDSIAKITKEYSFAYLKELYVSSIMEWIGSGETAPIEDVMHRQTAILAQEMRSGIKEELAAGSGRSSRNRMPPGFRMPPGLPRP